MLGFTHYIILFEEKEKENHVLYGVTNDSNACTMLCEVVHEWLLSICMVSTCSWNYYLHLRLWYSVCRSVGDVWVCVMINIQA